MKKSKSLLSYIVDDSYKLAKGVVGEITEQITGYNVDKRKWKGSKKKLPNNSCDCKHRKSG
jgi:hypothetical protein